MSKELEALEKIRNFICKNIDKATVEDCTDLGSALGIIQILVNRYDAINTIMGNI